MNLSLHNACRTKKFPTLFSSEDKKLTHSVMSGNNILYMCDNTIEMHRLKLFNVNN